MSESNRVVWSEGLFLRPQHFQQQDRFHESQLQRGIDALQASGWGFSEWVPDRDALRLGRVALTRIAGRMPDGSLFRLPDDGPVPLPVEIPIEVRDTLVCLTWPLRRPGSGDTALDPAAADPSTRWQGAVLGLRDTTDMQAEAADVMLGRPALRLMLARDLTPDLMAVPVARVIERRADGQVVLDESHVAPVLDVAASPVLGGLLRELHGLLRQRANALAARVSQPGTKGVADFADFLLLQVCNRHAPVFAHWLETRPLHPLRLYERCLDLAGELATFARTDRRAPEFPAYRHDALDLSFRPVIEEIRRALTAVLEQTAIAIPLQDRGRGVFVGAIPDVNLLNAARFVVAATADLPSEQVRSLFATQVKIGSVERIRDLVLSHLPGITSQPLPVAPRQIPYHAGFHYFELDRSSDYWKGLEVSRVMAMHVAGEFPGLQLELWAIRD